MTIQKKSILLFISAENFCEQEFLTVKTILQRKGFTIFISSDANSLCKGSSSLKVKHDVDIKNIKQNNFGAFVILGGKGIINYWNNVLLKSAVLDFYNNGKIVSSICAAGVVLAKSGILINKEATVYPEHKKEFDKADVLYVDQKVVISKNIITAKDPSSSVDFANAIVSRLSN